MNALSLYGIFYPGGPHVSAAIWPCTFLFYVNFA